MTSAETIHRGVASQRPGRSAPGWTRATLACAVMALAAWPAGACSIPVYHFALAYWAPDDYVVDVFHSGAIDAARQAAVDRLVAARSGGPGGRKTNLAVRIFDTASLSPAQARELADRDVPANLPALVVHYPQATSIRRPLWTAPLTVENVEAIVDSPMRREVARRLMGGHAAVWVLVDGGNRRADDRAYQLAADELRRLEGVLQLPEFDAFGPDGSAARPTEVPPGTISFPLLRISRDDAAEAVFAAMLLGSEADLAQLGDQPMLFPIYGRGRALYALVGDGINAFTLSTAGQFMIGPCSCEVKAANPGTDLLMTAAWTEGLGDVGPMPVISGMSGLGDFSDRAERARDLTESFVSGQEAPAFEVTVEIGPAAASSQPPRGDAEPVTATDATAPAHQRQDAADDGALRRLVWLGGAAVGLVVAGSILMILWAGRRAIRR